MPLDGLSFVVTGSLRGMSRSEVKALIQKYGGRVVGSVSSKTDYLLAGESPGSKLQKAIELDIPVISVDDLQEMVSTREG
jgi:DNA ligase (NAD+)